MNHSETISKIAPALIRAQSRIRALSKDATNDFFRSKYLTLDKIVEHLKPILTEEELAIVQGSTYPVTDEHGMLRTVTLETMLIHSSGEWLSNTVVMPVGTTFDKEKKEVGPTPQTGGSSVTYGRRYGIGAFFSIVTDEDDDGNAASQPPAPAKRTAKATEKPAPVDAAPITRESEITFGSMKGKKISDMKDAFLQWGLEDGRHFGPRTKEWQDAFRSELAHRDGATNG